LINKNLPARIDGAVFTAGVPLIFDPQSWAQREIALRASRLLFAKALF
jgi:hypothetical protein